MLGRIRARQVQLLQHHRNTSNGLNFLQQTRLQRRNLLDFHLLQLLSHRSVFFQYLVHRRNNILRIAQCDFHLRQLFQLTVDIIQSRLLRHRLNPSNTGSHTRLTQNLEEANLRGIRHMRSATQFHRIIRIKLNHTNIFAIFFTKQSRRPHLLRLRNRHVTMLFQCDALADFFIHTNFNLCDFLIRHLAKMRKIKTQSRIIHQTTLLGHVRSQCLLQSTVHQMRCAVIATNAVSATCIHLSRENLIHIFWQILTYQNMQFVLFLGIQNPHNLTVFPNQLTRIAHLTATFGVKRTNIQYQLIQILSFGYDGSMSTNLGHTLRCIIPTKRLIAVGHDGNPIPSLLHCIGLRAIFLCLQGNLKTIHIHRTPTFAGDQIC